MESEDECDERLLDLGRDVVTSYFQCRFVGKSKRVRGGYKFVVVLDDRVTQCSVSVLWRDEGLSLLFSPKPDAVPETFQHRVEERVWMSCNDTRDAVPKLTFGGNQGRFCVHVPGDTREDVFNVAVRAICSVVDAHGPDPSWNPARAASVLFGSAGKPAPVPVAPECACI